jgi:hypothetical protein
MPDADTEGEESPRVDVSSVLVPVLAPGG